MPLHSQGSPQHARSSDLSKHLCLNDTSARLITHELSLVPRILADEAPWCTTRLREEMQACLREAGLDPSHWLAVIDKDGNGLLRKHEWLMHFKKLVVSEGGSETLWYTFVRQAVSDAFDEIDFNNSGRLSLGEVRLWLEPRSCRFSGVSIVGSPLGTHPPSPTLPRPDVPPPVPPHMLSPSVSNWARGAGSAAIFVDRARRQAAQRSRLEAAGRAPVPWSKALTRYARRELKVTQAVVAHSQMLRTTPTTSPLIIS